MKKALCISLAILLTVCLLDVSFTRAAEPKEPASETLADSEELTTKPDPTEFSEPASEAVPTSKAEPTSEAKPTKLPETTAVPTTKPEPTEEPTKPAPKEEETTAPWWLIPDTVTVTVNRQLTECVDGYYVQREDGTQSFFYYDVSSVITVNVIFKDGHSEPIESWNYDIIADYQYEEPWSVGPHTATVDYGGITENFTVEVVPHPIKNITAKQTRDIIEMASGEYANGRFIYQYDDAFEYTVSFNDGTPDITGRSYEISNRLYELYEEGFYVSDSQWDGVPWSVGENKATAHCMGRTFDFVVTISESPISRIMVSAVKSINVKKDARVFDAYNEVTDEYDSVMVYRLGSLSFDFTVFYKNGDKKTFTYYYYGVFDGQSVMTEAVKEYYSRADQKYYTCFRPDNNDQVGFSFMGFPFTVTLTMQETDDNGNAFGYLEQNGAAYITDYYGRASAVSIPSEIGGLKVVGVQSLNLSEGRNVENIRKLTVPDSVTSVSSDVFADLVNCEEITIGKGVQTLTAEMFSECDVLQKINVSKDNPNYRAVDGAVYDKACAVLVAYPQGKAESETAYNVPDTVRDIDAYLSSDFAGQVSVGDKNPNFTSKDGVLYNKDITRVIRCGRDYSGAYKMPATVTELAEGAFAGCLELTSVEISDKVTEIVYYSFAQTRSLTKVTIPASVKSIGKEAFAGSGLKTVSLTAVETIEEDAFTSSGIQTVKASDKLISIGDNAFSYCFELTSFPLPKNLTAIGANAFQDAGLTSVDFPDALQTIGTEAFKWCESLTDVSFGTGLTVIPEKCFEQTSVDKVVIPQNIEVIEDAAFAHDPLDGPAITILNKDIAIARCAFPSHLEIKIGNRTWISGTSAFLSADGKQFVYPDTVTDIVYGEMSSYSEVYQNRTVTAIPSAVVHVGAHAFDGNNVSWDNEEDAALADVKGDVNYLGDVLLRVKTGSKAEKLAVREGTRIIADDAFEMSSVKDVTLPEGTEIIGYASFYNSALEKITLPSTLKTINAFAFCKTALKKIALPASLTEIGDFALASGSLETITVDPENTAFTVADGILYTKDMTELVYCPRSVIGELHVPSSVRIIRKGAFADNEGLTSVYVPRYVQLSEEAAFGRTVSAISELTKGYPMYVNYSLFSSPVVYVVKGTDAEEAVKDGVFPFRYYEAPVELMVKESDRTHNDKDGQLRVLNGTTADELLSISTGTRLLDKEGNPADPTAALGTGMRLVLEEDGKITDSILIVVPGDVDGDSDITSADARLALRTSVGLEKDFTDGTANYQACDVDNEQTVSSADARLILRASVGLEDTADWVK